MVDPESYDVLMPEMDEKKLREDVAEIVGIPYLQEAIQDEADHKVDLGLGFMYSKHLQTIFPCVVSRDGKAHWMFFIVDPGAPLTYLSAQASKVLGERRGPFMASIAGHSHISPAKSHFADVNILGADFITAYDVALVPNRDERTVKLIFNFSSMWDINSRKL